MSLPEEVFEERNLVQRRRGYQREKAGVRNLSTLRVLQQTDREPEIHVDQALGACGKKREGKNTWMRYLKCSTLPFKKNSAK